MTVKPELPMPAWSGGDGAQLAVDELRVKILAAFHHAYANGLVDVAQRLISALERCQSGDEATLRTAPVAKARLWMRFVQRRDAYKAMRRRSGEDAFETVSAARAMREAYRHWSDL